MNRFYIKLAGMLGSLLLMTTACEDYLDKTIETNLDQEEVFKNFDNVQGFVEEMYAMVVNYGTATHWQGYMCYGDDAIGNQNWQFDFHIDQGRYWNWINTGGTGIGTYFYNENPKTGDNLPFRRAGVWQSSWAGIRKANLIIENANLIVDATQEEKDVLLGQAYFFRAFFHHEIMKFWGRIPYIDRSLDSEDWELARPETYKETALAIDDDFALATQLLPADWDNHPAGQKTKGINQFRATKGAAWSFKGKNLLFAASPLMKGSTDPYDYDQQLCEMATEAFAEVLKLDESGRYELATMDNYQDVFYSFSGTTGYIYPGSTEFIFSQSGDIGWFPRFLAQGFQIGSHCDQRDTQFPTHNYIHYNFGMADGLSTEDSPNYDPNNPWEGRDPRFYKWVVVDGDQMVENLGSASGDNEVHRFAQLYDGGAHRFPTVDLGSQTGYLSKKWYGLSFNQFDNKIGNYLPFRLHMRLTDVYLMYAEAAHAAYGAQQAPSFYSLTAEQAINVLRNRAGVGAVQFASDNQKFMDEIRRERAVELSWEGHRWMDLRRWRLGELDRYKEKTGLRFDEGRTFFQEEVIRTKVFEEKHYWLPFPQNDTQLYAGFGQNPGW
ncbi:RagB/SusD family nutrient uptake outer membrane protein [Tunicatimonas pelagia]|uniref:RagB/SusD family nutrient uptake outer membrane protein n=1 Tax=Tunicatimonas pelagia TaxID=931531 RepID=UPI0026660CFF|nr:RagB/SusD family nutrient uptake outer membrane protein [Tunicatimonas pelagia]WKN44124.1 RagB/SusD family nutrient uptake outer membrane protein [Tunicatimonas pelagia]